MLRLIFGCILLLTFSFTPLQAQSLEEGDTIVSLLEECRMMANNSRLIVKPIAALGEQGPHDIGHLGKALLICEDVLLLSPGDTVMFANHLREPTHDPNRRPDYSTTNYLENKGIAYSQYIPAGGITSVSGKPSWRQRVSHKAAGLDYQLRHSRLSSGCSAFVSAILTGNREHSDPQTKQLLADAGIAHILAISGLHCAVLAGIFLWLLQPLNLLGSRKPRFIGAIVLMWTFVVFTGLPISAVRAAIMFTILLVAKLLQRDYSPFRSLIFAAIAIVAFDYKAALDPAFQLSFLTVAALIAFMPVGEPQHVKNRKLDNFTTLLKTTLVATFGSWALTAFYFGKLPLLFIPTNLLIVPLLPIYLSISLLYAILLTLGYDSAPIAFLLNSGYDGLEKIAAFCAPASVEVAMPAVGAALWLAALAALLIFLKSKGWKRKVAVSMSLLFAATSVASIWMLKSEPAPDGVIIQTHKTHMAVAMYDKGEEKIFEIPNATVSTLNHAGKKIVFLDNEKSFNGQKDSCDILVLGAHCPKDLKTAISPYAAAKVLIHNSMHHKLRKRFLAEGLSYGLDISDMAQTGPFEISED